MPTLRVKVPCLTLSTIFGVWWWKQRSRSLSWRATNKKVASTNANDIGVKKPMSNVNTENTLSGFSNHAKYALIFQVHTALTFKQSYSASTEQLQQKLFRNLVAKSEKIRIWTFSSIFKSQMRRILEQRYHCRMSVQKILCQTSQILQNMLPSSSYILRLHIKGYRVSTKQFLQKYLRILGEKLEN